jgi:hypothetical protein
MLVAVFLLVCSAEFSLPQHRKRSDPAMSWLSYAVREAPSEIQFFSAMTKVPQHVPVTLGGKPAFWMGLAPADGMYLAQPISTKFLNSSYFAFVETCAENSPVLFFF